MSKPGGNPRVSASTPRLGGLVVILTSSVAGLLQTMFFGMAAVAAGLGAFYYSQSYFHKDDDQTCESRAAAMCDR